MARTKQAKGGCYVKAKRLVLRTLHYLADAVVVFVANEALHDEPHVYDHEEEHRCAFEVRSFMEITRKLNAGHAGHVRTAKTRLRYLHEFLDGRFDRGMGLTKEARKGWVYKDKEAVHRNAFGALREFFESTKSLSEYNFEDHVEEEMSLSELKEMMDAREGDFEKAEISLSNLKEILDDRFEEFHTNFLFMQLNHRKYCGDLKPSNSEEAEYRDRMTCGNREKRLREAHEARVASGNKYF